MKITMLSDYSGRLDEGMRNTAFYLWQGLAPRHRVHHICLRPLSRLLRPGFWRSVSASHPQIIHYIPGPTFKSFLMVRALKAICHQAKTVMSATHPFPSRGTERLIPFLRPDLVLVQTPASQALFQRLGCSTRFLPSGVDTEKFIPVSLEKKLQLRQKYQLEESKFIVLHVGHLEVGRNLQLLAKLQQEPKIQVLIVSSLSVHREPEVDRYLKDAGCLVWHKYFENVAELYALSDCYVFPTLNRRNSIELPLSVMEAMSCNIPVVSTPFGGLPSLFTEGDGLYYGFKEEDTISLVLRIKQNGVRSATRQKVLPYSWAEVVLKLEQIYEELLR